MTFAQRVEQGEDRSVHRAHKGYHGDDRGQTERLGHQQASEHEIARQPEASNDIRANMILTAAFIEGVALFAVIAGILAMFV